MDGNGKFRRRLGLSQLIGTNNFRRTQIYLLTLVRVKIILPRELSVLEQLALLLARIV